MRIFNPNFEEDRNVLKENPHVKYLGQQSFGTQFAIAIQTHEQIKNTCNQKTDKNIPNKGTIPHSQEINQNGKIRIL